MSLEKLFADNQNKPRRFEIVAAAQQEPEIFLYDTIGGWGVEPGPFVKELKALTASTIHLRINSPGGDVFAARAMAAAIAEHPAKIIAHIDGLAASAASFLMLAADEIVAGAGTFVMIHNPWMLAMGQADDLRKQAELLDKIGSTMAADYAKKSGKSLDEVKAWMDAETWFTADEAIAAGLVDKLAEATKANAQWNLSAYRHAPEALSLLMVAAIAQSGSTTEVQGNPSAPDGPGLGKFPSQKKEGNMPDPNEAGQTAAPDAATISAAAKKAERERVSEINRIGIAAKMPAAQIQAAIGGDVTIEAWKDTVLTAMVAATNAAPTQIGSESATIIRDGADTRRDVMIAAVLNRINPTKFTVDAQNEFRMMSCLRMAEESLVKAGISVRGLSPNEIAIKAMQQTSDFANVLENSARKLLLAAYSYMQPTYKLWTKPSTTADFKTMSRARISETPAFLKVPEGAQITLASMSDSKEQYAIATYGRGISFTRQMLINDDLGAFNDLIQAFGLQASILENKTVYAILTANAAMSDTLALFEAGTHKNLGTGVIGNTALDAMFTAMGIMKGLDGASVLNLEPKFLIVPKAKEATAKAAMTAVGPNVKTADQNWFANRLTVVADGVLDATSTVEWYGAADPTMYPGIEYAHLEGANGPQMIREENGQAILGVNLYAYLDFGAKAVDWRPLYKSSGA